MVAPLPPPVPGHPVSFSRILLRRPALSLGAALVSALTGFAAAALIDSLRWPIRAEGTGSEFEDRKANLEETLQNDPDPDVWPKLNYSFPVEIDLLAPEPLVLPIPSMGPARAHVATLIAALKRETTPTPTDDHERIRSAVSIPMVPEINRRPVPSTAKLTKPTRALQNTSAPNAATARPNLQAAKKKTDISPADQTKSNLSVFDQPRLFD